METSGPALLNRSSPTTANPDGYGYFIYLFIYLIFYLFIFRERGREGEKHQCVVASGALPPPPPLGTWPTTQACTLTRNWTGYSLVCRPALNPLSYTSQGWSIISTGNRLETTWNQRSGELVEQTLLHLHNTIPLLVQNELSVHVLIRKYLQDAASSEKSKVQNTLENPTCLFKNICIHTHMH